jgi:hypothetical protein
LAFSGIGYIITLGGADSLRIQVGPFYFGTGEEVAIMDWLALITTVINRMPFERFLVPHPDHTKALEDFVKSLPRTESQKEAPSKPKTGITTQETKTATALVTEERKTPQLPTTEETRQVLRRRLAKELYRAELDLAGGLRISGKPCDCLDSKHSLGLEATAEELISSEPDNPVYQEILVWLQDNRPKLTIEAISSGQHDNEYPQMAAQFRGFRKRIMGTTALTAMIEPKARVNLEEAKKMAAEEATRRVEETWGKEQR